MLPPSSSTSPQTLVRTFVPAYTDQFVVRHVNDACSPPPRKINKVVLVSSAVKVMEKYCRVVVTAKVVVVDATALLPNAVTLSEPAVVATAPKVKVMGTPLISP
jgi:hypothetical protein